MGQFGGDNRAGIDRTLHRISCIRNRNGKVVGLTCRVGRAIKGSANMVHDLVLSGASILFLGRYALGCTSGAWRVPFGSLVPVQRYLGQRQQGARPGAVWRIHPLPVVCLLILAPRQPSFL